METKFDYANDVGKQNARMMANRYQNLTIEEKQAMNTYDDTGDQRLHRSSGHRLWHQGFRHEHCGDAV